METKNDKPIKKETDGRLYQPVVIFNDSVKVGFHRENRAIQLYSHNVFFEPATATKFFGIFIKQLIDAGTLPKKVVKSDGTTDDNLIKTGINEILLTDLELEDMEWKT